MMGLEPDGATSGHAVSGKTAQSRGRNELSGGEADRDLLAHGRRIFPYLGGFPWVCHSLGAVAHRSGVLCAERGPGRVADCRGGAYRESRDRIFA